MTQNNQPKFTSFALKSMVAHSITYFIMGILASTFLNYAERFARPEMACWMRPTTDPIIMFGVLFQPIRGLIFAIAFFPLREILFTRKNGWLIMWLLLTTLGILSTFGPAPGSVEGMIYTVIPVSDQLTGWLEVVPQALLYSLLLFYWIQNADKRWLSWLLWSVFVILMILPILGALAGQVKAG